LHGSARYNQQHADQSGAQNDIEIPERAFPVHILILLIH